MKVHKKRHPRQCTSFDPAFPQRGFTCYSKLSLLSMITSMSFLEGLYSFRAKLRFVRTFSLELSKRRNLSLFFFRWLSEKHLKNLLAVFFCDLTRLLVFAADMYGVLSSAKFAVTISLNIKSRQ